MGLSTDIDNCSPDPCANGGTCVDLVDDYICRCEDGWEDKNCTSSKLKAMIGEGQILPTLFSLGDCYRLDIVTMSNKLC